MPLEVMELRAMLVHRVYRVRLDNRAHKANKVFRDRRDRGEKMV